MTTRTKEEQQLLDEKIARIQKKNEEILRRRKEVEEDKRLAEKQNATVKVRPSTGSVTDRERTPALRPSRRELKHEFSDENNEPVVTERSSRGGLRGRGSGVERYRGQSDWKATGPPPDPRSFLYDDERDAPEPKDRDEKGDGRRDLNRRRREMEREEYRGGREFERQNQRGGSDHRSDRGRRGGRGGFSRNQEDAWREERMRIDEARIQRQKSEDGRWRREWDNEKIEQEQQEETRYEPRKINPTSEELRRPPSRYHSAEHRGLEDIPHGMPRESPRRGRGRGRLHPAELEMPLESIPLEIFQKQISPARKSGSELSFVDDRQRPHIFTDVPSLFVQDSNIIKKDSARKIERVGETFKISISNSDATQSTPKPQRQVNDIRGRFRSQPSYSSQSDEDSPRDRGPRGNRRPRSHKYQRSQEKPGNSPIQITKTLPAECKPPLPPLLKPKINEDDDGSWEDVTTSGTESLGDELLSTHSNPTKSTVGFEPSDNQFDQYLEKVGVFESVEASGIRVLDQGDIVFDQSYENGKGINVGECMSLETSSIISSTDDSPDAKSSGIRTLDKEDLVLDHRHEIDKGKKSDECISQEFFSINSTDASPDAKTRSNTGTSSLTSSKTHDISASSANCVNEKHVFEGEKEEKHVIERGSEPNEEILYEKDVNHYSLETKTETSESLSKDEFKDLSICETSLEKEVIEQTTLLLEEEKSGIGESLILHDD